MNIDIHAHLVPIELIEATRTASLPTVDVTEHGENRYSFSIGGEATRVLPSPLLDREERLDWMDGAGIDLQIVGTWADLFGYTLPVDEGVVWSRILNQTLLEACSGSDRLGSFASLPLQAPTLAAEMVHEVAADGFLGVTFATQVAGIELDDPRLEVVWAALSETKMIAFIHPGFAASDARTADYGMTNAVGRPVDTTIATARLLGAAIPERFPGAKIVLAHGGGAISLILGRLRRNHQINSAVGDPDAGLARLHFDTVVFDPDALCYLVSKATLGSVFLGSDYPFPIGDPSPIDVVVAANCLSESERTSILGSGAAALLGIEGRGGEIRHADNAQESV